MKKRQTKTCENCGEAISLSNFIKHINSKSCLVYGGKNKNKHAVHPWNDWRIGEDLFRLPCGYEGNKKYCTNYLNSKNAKKNGVSNIIAYNKTRKEQNIPAHNKGKKASAEHKQKISDALKKHHAEHGPKTPSKEARLKMSQAKKDLYKKHPEKHPNRKVAGNRRKMTYPEQVAYDWFLDKEIRAHHNKILHGYYPDFRVGMTIIEIDGERWHSSVDQVTRDQKRDAVLQSKGYTVHRIKSQERIEHRLIGVFGEY